MLRGGVAASLMAVTISACSGATSTTTGDTTPARDPLAPEAEPPPEGFELTIDGSLATGYVMEVTGSSTLPSGTVVDVVATRTFQGEGAGSPQGARLGQGEATVADGQYDATIPLENEFLLAGVDLEGLAIATVSPKIALCASIETGLDEAGQPRQPNADVRGRLGENGEALTGSDGASVFGSSTPNPSTWIGVMMLVEDPPPVQQIEAAQGLAPTVAPLKDFCV